MDVNIDSSSRVFFFIKKAEDTFGEVLVPDMAGISINKENRPVVLRCVLANHCVGLCP